MPRRLRIGFARQYRVFADRGAFSLSGNAADLRYDEAEEVPYDLYGTDTAGRGTIPFAVNWPAAPTITNTGTVTNNTQLTEALNTPGIRATVEAGSYNALTITQDNQHWICDDSATFAGFGGSGFEKVIFEGGNVITIGATQPNGFSDLLVRNVNFQVQSFEFGVGTSMFSRCAVIHCTVYALRTGFFTPGATASDAGVFGYDMIAAANYVSGGMTVGNSGVEPAFRIQSVKRAILVDNRARCGFDGQGIKNTYRSHYGNDDHWGRRNMTEYGDGILWSARANNDPVVAGNRMGAHYWYDHRFHSPNKSAYAFRGANGGSIAADWLEPIVVDGNQGFFTPATGSGPYWAWNGQAGDSIGSGTSSSYQAPPALSEWLAADGLPPGADH